MGQRRPISVTDQPPAEPQAADGRSALGRLLAQQAAVAEMAQRALSERDLGKLLDEACVLAGRVLEADLVDVLEMAPDGQSLRIVAGIGWRPGVVGELVVPAESGSQSGYTMATGGPVIANDLHSETRFTTVPALLDHGAQSGISVRIGDPDRPYGVLAAFSMRRRTFSHDDAGFLESLSNVLGSAVARVQAEADVSRSRDQLATIVGNVTDGIIVQGRDGRLLFANKAAARLTGFDKAESLVEASPDDILARFELLDEDGRPMALDRLPGRQAMLSGQPAPPTPVRFRIRATGEERWSLVQAAPVLGADGGVAQVINIFRDVTAEHRVDIANAVLAQIVAALTGTLDIDEAARRLAELCVPRLADFCVVDLLEPDGTLRVAAIAHADPARVELGWRFRQLRPLQLTNRQGPARVIREGSGEVAEIDEALMRALGNSTQTQRILAELEPRRYICVPLQARGRPVGALTLVMAESGRGLTEDDVRLAEEIGSRAGVALENARLYEAVDDRRAELEAVISAMAEAVLLFDERGELRLSNRSAARLFGGTVPATVNELRDRLEPGDDDAARGADGRRGGPRTDIEGEMRLAGSGRWLEVNVYRPRVGGRARASHVPSVVILRDVTEARTAQLARDAFIGVLSHELRTPITTIYGGSELLERGLNDPQREGVVSDIRAESERLARLVEDLLVMTRAERGGVEIGDEPVLIQRVLPQLADSLAARWPELQVEMRLGEALPAVRGDVTYLEQVLRNLLTNAVRYGDGLAAGIEVEAQPSDDEVVVRVLDHGPGPGTETPERLFELFYRAPAARVVPGGAGIGLFVCRQLVEAMGGRIWARPRDGGGSEFGFALPIIEADVYG